MESQDYHSFLFGTEHPETGCRAKPSDAVLSKIEFNELGFEVLCTIKPSPDTDDDELKSNTDAYDKYFGDKANYKYQRVPLQCYRFEKLSIILTQGDQVRVVAPPKPEPSGCKGVTGNELSLDVLNLIYDALKENSDSGTAICLALTCSGFYRAYKTLNPVPINLWTYVRYPMWAGPYPQTGEILIGWKTIWVGELLEEWMGPKYRHVSRKPACEESSRNRYWPYFLNREIYGDGTTKADMDKETAMLSRYDDWWNMGTDIGGMTGHLLPSPHNKSKKWYKEAGLAIIRDAERRETWRDWRRFWLKTQAFRKVPYWDKLKVTEIFERREEIAKNKGPLVRKLGRTMRCVNRHLLYFLNILDKREQELAQLW